MTDLCVTKSCTSCGRSKPLDAFHRQAKGKHGRQAKCSECTSAAYYAPNKEKRLEASRRRRSTEQGRERERAWQRNRRRTNPLPRMLLEAKARAAQKGLAFSLTVEDLEIPEVCPVLGIPLRMGEGQRADHSPSIDRVDSSRGYEPGNVRVISWRANRLKNDATLDELRAIVAYMERALP